MHGTAIRPAGRTAARWSLFFLPGALVAVIGLGLIRPAASQPQAATGPETPAAEGAETPRPNRLLDLGAGLCYGLSKAHGFLVSEDDGRTWEARNEGLPRKTIYPGQTVVRCLTSVSADPLRPERVAVTTAGAVFLSEDRGRQWTRLAAGDRLGQNVFLTAVALSPWDRKALLLGTSFGGVFETRDLGKTWTNVSGDLKGLYRGAGFWEDITALTYYPETPGAILLACGFGGGLYLASAERKQLAAFRPPGLAVGQAATLLQLQPEPTAEAEAGSGRRWLLQIGTRAGTVFYSLDRREIRAGVIPPGPEEPVDPGRAARMAKAAGKAAIYLTAYQARGAYLDKHFAFMRGHGFNALVVDCKDDLGNVTYLSKLPAVRRLAAAKNLVDPASLLQKAKAQGVYVVARVVVFKDQRLYEADGCKYAAWDGISNQPWGNLRQSVNPKTKAVTTVQGEHWLDPYARDVWEYNVAIAKELEDLGFDEIQFDYIRFPTDGNLSRIKYRYRPEGAEKADALESFLAMARERLQVPISTDLYGFNCWYRIEGWTGQNLELFAPYIDVVCPMFYPSHFPSSFANNGTYLDRARTIYHEGTTRAHVIAGGGVLVRPYVQAFLIGGELKMNAASYTKYLTNQIDGTLAAPSSGYTLWNAACSYYMVKAPVPQPPALPPASPQDGKVSQEPEAGGGGAQ